MCFVQAFTSLMTVTLSPTVIQAEETCQYFAVGVTSGMLLVGCLAGIKSGSEWSQEEKKNSKNKKEHMISL